jgi:hypothetical protein
MMSLIKNTIISGVSYLSSNRVPPNTSPENYERLKSINHMESKKFYIVLTSVVILAFFYFSSIGIMFLLPKGAPEVVSGFVTIFSKTIEILSIIIATYVGAQAAVDLKYGSASNASITGNTYTEKAENITVIHTNAKEDDYELF